jgi:hypothetical protein
MLATPIIAANFYVLTRILPENQALCVFGTSAVRKGVLWRAKRIGAAE